MNLLEYLRRAAKSDTSVYTTFLQQYNKQDNSIHIFHEGKDDPSFYGNFIHNRGRNKRRIFYYQAKNKEKVYENYSKINWTAYSKKRVIFFVDKDFSDILRITYPIDINIFVTTHYSIENYLVSKSLFSRSIREIIGLDNDKINNAISKQFQLGLNSFYQASLLLSAYFLYHRKMKKPLNLNNITIADMFTIDETFHVRRKSNILQVLDRKTGVTSVTIIREIRKIINELKRINNPKSYTRGKFELAYMINCINKSPDIINRGKQKGEKKYKCCVLLSPSNSIPILAPRLKQPKEFNEFMNRLK
ncbi:MAG: DUF4435 domain-containing protein [Chitinophagaceae bacterium]|nr:DUF4435 domain-containing protein [Chitinophagaceae bacterium]